MLFTEINAAAAAAASAVIFSGEVGKFIVG